VTPLLFIDPLDGPVDPWGSISTTFRTTEVDFLYCGKVNIAAVIDSGYKLLQEKHNNPVQKKNRNFV